ncbi:MAG: ribosome recycling factor [Thermomicrobiales bacterium]|nr:ribosome recycling factor [Thermomicrobiales bacterium]MCO5219239.1 ribosome recycling factor [Thermomicrobiales bacterium]MCO5226278.1 ribosome recycling factor [Thermomicrobiales bacterium]MCO5228094.1 ribosome recycling factor [Thermomicrobiales bacterium]
MTVASVLKDTEERMSKSMDALHHHLGSIRTGRANPAMVEDIQVEAYGSVMPLNQLASISAPEARMLVIQPWDKGGMKAIEKAIMASDLGITPNNDGVVIRLAIPMLNEERRKQMVKQVHNHVEEAKISVRNIRRDAMQSFKTLVSDKAISEDDEKRAHDQLETLTKKYVEMSDSIGKEKEAEVLEV